MLKFNQNNSISMQGMPAAQLFHRAKNKKPHIFWIISFTVIFALYGQSINFAGQLRYIELLLLLIAIFNFSVVLNTIGKWERLFVSLFLLTALMQLLSDLYTNADSRGTVSRVGTYVLLAVLIPIMKWLGKNNWLRIRWILLGYAISYLTLLYFGGATNPAYYIVPWRLGVGYAVTIALCLAIAWQPKYLFLGSLVIIALAAFHFLNGARSLALITFIVGSGLLLSHFRRNPIPFTIKPMRLTVLSCCGLILLFGIYKVAEYGTNQKWYPDELQSKMELQFSHPYGIIASGRPDTVSAIYAIIKRPFLGHGSTNLDLDVWAFYTDLVSSNYSGNTYTATYTRVYNYDKLTGNPSHSHLLSAGADAGIIAMVSWFILLCLSIYVGGRSFLWHNRFAPLFTFIAMSNIWDIIFSPGPHRMDMAIRIMILLFALSCFKEFSRKPQPQYFISQRTSY